MKLFLRTLVLAGASAVLPVAASAQQVKDSAGAKVIRYTARDRARAQWTVEPKPLFKIGGADGSGPTELANVLGVARLTDGRVVIADAGSTELRVFSPAGQFQRAVGRKGSGPGEFNGIAAVFRSADSIVVQDRALRLQTMAGDGALVHSYGRPIFTGHGVNTWLGMFADGSGVVQGVDPIVDSTSVHSTATATLGIRPPSSDEARAFTQIAIYERLKKNGTFVGLFLGAVSRVAVMGERVCSGYTLHWDVQCFDRNGKLLTRTMRDIDPGAVTPGDIDEFKKGYAVANKSTPPERIKAALDRLEFAEKRSAFGRFVPSTTGELWIGPFVVLESFVPGRRGPAIPAKPTSWTVLGKDGTWAADVTLPAKFVLMDAGPDYVAGVELDDDDVESVVVYRLRR